MSVTDYTKEITPDIDKTEDKDKAIAEFAQLRNNPGWQRVVSLLDKKIEDYTQSILDTDVQGNELKRERDRRDLCLWLRNIPEILIEALQSPTQPEKITFDPYERLDNKQLTDSKI